MNNLWHTNFRAEHDGVAAFNYFFSVHDKGFNNFDADKTGLNNDQPLIATTASADKTSGLFFKLTGKDVYVEAMKPADDGNGVILQIVNAGSTGNTITLSPQNVPAIKVYESNLMEDKKLLLKPTVIIQAKEVMTLRIEKWPRFRAA